jgi:3-methyladenine DNA glycosylase AlkD
MCPKSLLQNRRLAIVTRTAPGLLKTLRRALRQAGDPIRAPAMQAYMKSVMPYHGVPAPLVRSICRHVFVDVEFESAAHWQKLVLAIWHGARFREERYAAMILAADRRAREFQTLPAVKLYEEMIITGAWWDFVDDIASHRIGAILRAYPLPMQRKLLAWSKSKNLWLRRTAILSQLGFKSDTDLGFLYACIEPSLDSREFFLQKAIGWALRQYAWTDSSEIREYARLNRSRLSALSYREAIRNIG